MASDESAPRMRLWKRIVLIGLSIGIGLVIAGTAVGLGFYWYYEHARPTRTWPEIDMPQQYLKVNLTTKWRGGQLNYLLTISPKSPSLVGSFDKAVRAETAPLQITILLTDSAGFKLCSIPVDGATLIHLADDQGRYAGLSANNSTFECSYGDYSDATAWNIAYQNLPVAADIVPLPAPIPARAQQHTPRAPRMATEGTDILSGVDAINGQLDTASGHVFDVYLSGEKYTILMWNAGTEIKFNCKTPSNCTVVNTATQETVHAHLEK